MNLRSYSCFVIAALGLIGLAGCGESGPKTVPVYGNITFVGRDAPNWCHIYFTPMKTDGLVRPTFAERQSNGAYKAKSYSTSRGILPGTYHVRVNWYQLKPGKDPNKESNWDEIQYEAGELVVDPTSSGIERNIEIPQKI